jgi:hypothetical protein
MNVWCGFHVEVDIRICCPFFVPPCKSLVWIAMHIASGYTSQLRQPASGHVRVDQIVQVSDQSISVGKLLTSSSNRPTAQKTQILNEQMMYKIKRLFFQVF